MDMDGQQYQDTVIDTCLVTTLRGVVHTQKEVNREMQVGIEDLFRRVE